MLKLKKSAVSRLLAACLAAAVLCLPAAGCNNKDEAVPATASVEESSVTSVQSKEESSEPVSKEPASQESSEEESQIVEPTVEPVENFSVANTDENSVTLTWSVNEEASGYDIYRAPDDENNEFQRIITIRNGSTGEYMDNQVAPGRLYYYRIVAYVFANDKNYYSTGTLTNATTTIADVENLYSSSQGTNEITIEWNCVEGASGYIISRADDESGGEYKEIETLSGEYSTSYTDKDLSSCKKYSYQVKPYKNIADSIYYGGYSSTEAWTTAKTPAVKLSYNEKDSKINVKWSEVEGADGYEIYMSTTQEGDYNFIGSTEKTEFTTDKVKKDNIYYIRVLAYYMAGDEKRQSGYETMYIVCGNVPLVHGYNVGTTYIEISLEKQHMWFYKEGKLIVSTDVVTGYKNLHDTPTGLYYVISKSSPARLVGETWDVNVNYWIAVTYDGVGIHDSTWRYSGYGGNIYTYDGSHGCINTPYDEVKKIYENCDVNTPVVIY